MLVRKYVEVACVHCDILPAEQVQPASIGGPQNICCTYTEDWYVSIEEE